ncbi:MAG TPA: protein kinase [Methylocella sp.]|nr:protein kinase [Methylocella sp.]
MALSPPHKDATIGNFSTFAIPIGTKLNGLFEIDAFLASGGMGEVYKGHSIETGDKVAIKVIRADLASSEAAIAMFRNEAAALFRLHHEAIVRYFVFAVDPLLQRAYLVMEFVEGETLSQVLQRGPLPIETVCVLAERIALGLHAAHKKGTIHRDISPGNIVIQNGDVHEAKIIDFGISRSTLAAATVINVGFVGKYNYASPEQLGLYNGKAIRDEDISLTPKSDIYSLGLVIAEALRGSPVDMGETQAEIIEKRRIVPDLEGVDPRIHPFLEKMLQPDPSLRPGSMLEVADYFRILPPTVTGKGRPERRDVPYIVLGAALITIIGGGAAAYWLLTQPRRLTELPPRAKAAEFIKNYRTGPCFSVTSYDVTDSSATIDLAGNSREPFDSLDREFKAANGFEATINAALVTPAQCDALAFFNRMKSGMDRAPQLEERVHYDGQSLTGMITDSGGRKIDLLLIQDDGVVQNVTEFVQSGQRPLTFGIPAEQLRRGRQPQLLMVVASNESLSSLKPVQALPADQMFPAVVNEAADKQEALGVAMQYFFTGE